MNDERPSLIEVWELAGGTVIGHRDGWQKASCFLHPDRTPSASVNEDLGKWACFSCGERGDVYDVIQKWQNLETFKEVKDAVSKLGLQTVPSEPAPRSGLSRQAGARKRGGFTPSWRNM